MLLSLCDFSEENGLHESLTETFTFLYLKNLETMFKQKSFRAF